MFNQLLAVTVKVFEKAEPQTLMFHLLDSYPGCQQDLIPMGVVSWQNVACNLLA